MAPAAQGGPGLPKKPWSRASNAGTEGNSGQPTNNPFGNTSDMPSLLLQVYDLEVHIGGVGVATMMVHKVDFSATLGRVAGNVEGPFNARHSLEFIKEIGHDFDTDRRVRLPFQANNQLGRDVPLYERLDDFLEADVWVDEN